LWWLLADTFLSHNAPSGAKDTPVGANRDDGVHLRTADGLASAERVHGGLVISVFVRRFEVGDLSAAKDSFEREFEEELGS
jgi:hypothetical protein